MAFEPVKTEQKHFENRLVIEDEQLVVNKP